MDMKKMMKQAQKMQRDAAAAQQEIAAMTFEASAGGGMVKATATGEMAITDITIDPLPWIPRTWRCCRTWSSPP